jgi:hypothetical protein
MANDAEASRFALAARVVVIVVLRSCRQPCQKCWIAADFDLSVEFAQGGFIPAGDSILMRAAGSFAWLTINGGTGT